MPKTLLKTRRLPSPTAQVRPLRRVLLVTLWTLLAMTALAEDAGLNSAPDDELSAREQDLARIEQQVESIGAALAGDNAEREALIAELEERERDVAALAVAGRELSQMVREQHELAEDLRSRQDAEREALNAERRRLAVLVKTAHQLGRGDVLRMLLNQEDPVQATRVMSYFTYFNRARLERIAAVSARADRLARLALDAEREMERLEALGGQQEATRKRLESARDERTAVLAALEGSIHSRRENMVLLRQDAENLKRLVNHLRQRAEIRAELEIERLSFESRRGQLPWPLPGHRISAGFGSLRGQSGVRWDGVLLSASEGERVRAVHDGRVIYTDWLRGFGLLIVVDHGDGYMTLYGHNETLLKEVGEWVRTGEVIALSGKSGRRGEPVLYFAIRRNGKPLNPSNWCG